MDELQNRIPEVHTPNACREWRADGRIILFTLKSMNRDAVDLWAELLIEASNAWPVERPWLLIHNIATVNAALTPYARKRVDDVNNSAPPNLRGRVAIITGQSILARLIRLYVNTMRRNSSNLEKAVMRVFFDQDKAEAWLLEMCDEAQVASNAPD